MLDVKIECILKTIKTIIEINNEILDEHEDGLESLYSKGYFEGQNTALNYCARIIQNNFNDEVKSNDNNSY